MDDQQGNVIDGTARARQWRGSQSKPARAEGEGAAARSDAPKSIAGSLLVPADMLPAALSVQGQGDGDAESRGTERPPRSGPLSRDTDLSDDNLHENPFLAPEAAGPVSAGRRARPAHRRIAALLTRSVGVLNARRALSRAPRGLVARHRHRMGALRLTGLVVVVLAVAAIAFTAVILTQAHPAHRSLAAAVHSGGSARSPSALESGPFAAEANPFGRRRSAREPASHRARRVRAHRASQRHTRPRPAKKTSVVQARYTPPASTGGASAPASDTPSYASSGSAAAPAQPAASASSNSAASSNSSSTSSRPAFGHNGILGPGHSPNS